MGKIVIKKESADIIRAVIILVIGILFCFSKALGEKALSIIFGASFIVAGLVVILIPIIGKKHLLTPAVLLGCFALAFGIFSIVNNIVSFILQIIPWVLIVIGGVSILDVILMLVQRKEKNIPLLIIEIILGAGFLALGICLLLVNGFAEFAGLVFGIALIIYASYQLINMISEKKAK